LVLFRFLSVAKESGAPFDFAQGKKKASRLGKISCGSTPFAALKISNLPSSAAAGLGLRTVKFFTLRSRGTATDIFHGDNSVQDPSCCFFV
jgi:hypothetical protein